MCERVEFFLYLLEKRAFITLRRLAMSKADLRHVIPLTSPRGGPGIIGVEVIGNARHARHG